MNWRKIRPENLHNSFNGTLQRNFKWELNNFIRLMQRKLFIRSRRMVVGQTVVSIKATAKSARIFRLLIQINITSCAVPVHQFTTIFNRLDSRVVIFSNTEVRKVLCGHFQFF